VRHGAGRERGRIGGGPRLRRRTAARLGVAATLFEPLRSTKTHGLGLGLPIARALARAMHGDLLLEDTDRKAFRLELPLREGT